MGKYLLTQLAIYEDQQYHDWRNEGSMPLRGTDNRVWGRLGQIGTLTRLIVLLAHTRMASQLTGSAASVV